MKPNPGLLEGYEGILTLSCSTVLSVSCEREGMHLILLLVEIEIWTNQ
jgi:hypothetical protein